MSIQFLHILYYALIALFISIALILVSIIFVSRTYDIEKNSAYECGFHPFEDTRNKFEVRFYLVALLFIIFDLEVAFLFPWIVTFNTVTGYFEYINVLVFLYILLIGFYYEWQKGALDWE